MKKRAIISAALTAALMAAGMVGGTIAYFSQEAKTEVNITSGNFALTSVVSELKTYSLDVLQEEGKFENGGTAALNQSTQTITLDRMTPGDKATFKVTITLQNNINVKYHVVFDKSGELAPALEASVSGGAANWTTVNASENPTNIELDASIEIPFSTEADYLNKSALVRIVVVAVQNNMPTVSTPAALEQAIANIPSEGGEVNLYVDSDITLTQIMAIPSNSQINLYGDGTKTINNAENASRVINFNDVENSTLTISGVNLHQSNVGDPNYERTISIGGTTNCTLNVYDSTLTNDSHYPINVAGENTNLTINVENSVIEGYCAVNVWSAGTIVNLKGSTLRGVGKESGSSNSFATLVINEGATNVLMNINDCVVEAIQNGSPFEAFFFVKASGCAINSTNTIYKFKRSSTADYEIYDSIEKVVDYNTFIRIYKIADSAYTGTGSASVQYGDDPAELPYKFIYSNLYENSERLTEPGDNHLFGERQQMLSSDLAQETGSQTYSISDVKINGKKYVVCDYSY